VSAFVALLNDLREPFRADPIKLGAAKGREETQS
jgi:hypothetical protein